MNSIMKYPSGLQYSIFNLSKYRVSVHGISLNDRLISIDFMTDGASSDSVEINGLTPSQAKQLAHELLSVVQKIENEAE